MTIDYETLKTWEEEVKILSRDCPRPHELECYERIFALIEELREKEKAIDQLMDNYQQMRSDWISEVEKNINLRERLLFLENINKSTQS